jgi:hypothetical protein
MDEAKLRSALAMLRAIADKLPANGDIEEKYIKLYHDALTGIQEQLKEAGLDLSPFFIPDAELKHKVTVTRYYRTIRQRQQGVPKREHSEERFCDRTMFDIALAGAMSLIDGYLQSPSPIRLKRNAG